MGTLPNSEDPDEMQHKAAFQRGLHCLLKLKQPSVTEIHHHLETFTLRSTLANSILILSICMGKSIRIRVNISWHTVKTGLAPVIWTKPL